MMKMDIRPIDANALFDALRDNEFQTFCPLDEVDDVIDAAPTLDYAPVRHGEWIKDKDDLYWGNHFIHRRCSLCGGEPHINRFGTAYILSDYCPKCGAKMDGKEDA